MSASTTERIHVDLDDQVSGLLTMLCRVRGQGPVEVVAAGLRLLAADIRAAVDTLSPAEVPARER